MRFEMTNLSKAIAGLGNLDPNIVKIAIDIIEEIFT